MCARWCHTCGDYRPTLDALAAEFAARVLCVWVDIEDDEQAFRGVDVDDFPTLLIAADDDVRFFGPVTPHLQVARELVERALLDDLGRVDEARLQGMPGRIRALGRGVRG